MEELLHREYDVFLGEDEIQLAMIFYKMTHDQIKTIIICEELKHAFFAKTFGHKDTAALNRVNDEIAITICLRLIGKDEKYFYGLPDDTQSDVIDIFDAGQEESDMQKKLCSLLRISAPKKMEDKKTSRITDLPKDTVKETPINTENEKPSLMSQLKKFKANVNKKYGA